MFEPQVAGLSAPRDQARADAPSIRSRGRDGICRHSRVGDWPCPRDAGGVERPGRFGGIICGLRPGEPSSPSRTRAKRSRAERPTGSWLQRMAQNRRRIKFALWVQGGGVGRKTSNRSIPLRPLRGHLPRKPGDSIARHRPACLPICHPPARPGDPFRDLAGPPEWVARMNRAMTSQVSATLASTAFASTSPASRGGKRWRAASRA